MAISHGGSGDKAQAFLTPGEKKKQFRGRCFNCGQHNHMSRDCPKKKKETHARETYGGVALMTRATALLTRFPNGSTSSLLEDTGASHHIATGKEMFVDMQQSQVQQVNCGGGEQHPLYVAGTVTVQGDHGSLRLMNTLYVPSFKFNLFSGTAACKRGASIYAKGTTLTVVYKGRTVLTVDADNGLFVARAQVQHVKKVPEDSCMQQPCQLLLLMYGTGDWDTCITTLWCICFAKVQHPTSKSRVL
jgi:hypothetical protein